jgi:hypothetical protein
MSTDTVSMSKRELLLADIITTAIEGGIGYWSICEQYQWSDDGTSHVAVGERRPEHKACARIIETNDDDVRGAMWITFEVIEKGIERIVKARPASAPI